MITNRNARQAVPDTLLAAVGSTANHKSIESTNPRRAIPRLVRRSLTYVVMATAFLSAGKVGAVELYQAVGLPDAGNGSSANSWAIPSGADKMEVVGGMTLPNGLQVPVHWRYELSDGSTFLTELPIPAGHQGVANAIRTESTGECIACGTLIDGEGLSHAVLWREDEHEHGGAPAWFAAVPLADLDNGSSAKGIVVLDQDGQTEVARVAGDVTLPSGRTVPVVWSINLDAGETTPAQLPLPQGSEGTANAITLAENGDLIAVGTVNLVGLVSLAVGWTYDGESWSGQPLDTPPGADSRAIFVDGFQSGGVSAIAAVGETCDEVGCFATLWGPGGNSLNLHNNSDFAESSGNGLFGGSGALAVVGAMFANGGDVGAIFLPQADLAADVNKLLVNPEDGVVKSINDVGPGGLMVGRGNPCANPNVDCGVIFIPVDGIVAQRMNVPVGSVASGDVTSTWQDDADKLQIEPGQAGGQPTVVAGFEAQQIGTVGLLPELTINFSVNGVSSDENASWTVRVQAFNFLTGQWDNTGQVEATTTATEFSLEVPDAPNTHFDEFQSFRTRFQILNQTTSAGAWEFEFDELNITLAQEPG